MTEQLVTFETAKLAKQKGFDEVCRNMWFKNDIGAIEINAPKDEELIGGFLKMYAKYKNDPADFLMQLEKRTPKPLYNSTIPDVFYTRPTQDLLEDWLRDTHGIHIYAKITLGNREHNIPTLYVGGYYSTLYEDAIKWTDNKAFARRSEARESALQEALKTLNDAK